MSKLLSIIGAVAVVAAAALAILNFFYKISFSLSIEKKEHLPCECDADEGEECCGGDCCCSGEEEEEPVEAPEEEDPEVEA